jgi:hypothetical protein
MSEMGDIINAGDAAMSRLKYVDAFLLMIDRGIPELGQMKDNDPFIPILLDYVREACAGIRTMLDDVSHDVGDILRTAKGGES